MCTLCPKSLNRLFPLLPGVPAAGGCSSLLLLLETMIRNNVRHGVFPAGYCSIVFLYKSIDARSIVLFISDIVPAY